MVRRSLLWLMIGSATPAIAQAPDNAQVSGPIMVRDFMDAIPRLDEVPYEHDPRVLVNPPPRHREQITYHNVKRHAVAHSFIHDKKRGGTRGEDFGRQALAGFAAECIQKGGQLEPKGSYPFEATLEHLFNNSYQANWIRSTDSYDPVMELAICTASPLASLGALTVIRDRMTRQTAIVLFSPRAVVTQRDLDNAAWVRETVAAREIAQQREYAARLPKWRQGLSSGSETSCGPILGVRGEMVEIVDPRDRQPRWYRRSELMPVQRADGSLNSCG